MTSPDEPFLYFNQLPSLYKNVVTSDHAYNVIDPERVDQTLQTTQDLHGTSIQIALKADLLPEITYGSDEAARATCYAFSLGLKVAVAAAMLELDRIAPIAEESSSFFAYFLNESSQISLASEGALPASLSRARHIQATIRKGHATGRPNYIEEAEQALRMFKGFPYQKKDISFGTLQGISVFGFAIGIPVVDRAAQSFNDMRFAASNITDADFDAFFE